MSSDNRKKIEVEALPMKDSLAGGNIYRFQKYMLKSISNWEDYDYNDWLYYLELIKNKPLKLYIFFPFIYKILGIQIIHEYKKLNEVNESSRKYVDFGINENRLHINNLTENDLKLYQKEKIAMNKALEIRNRLISQGAILYENYILTIRSGDWKKSKTYQKKIKREDFTKIKVESIIQDRFLAWENDIEAFKAKLKKDKQ